MLDSANLENKCSSEQFCESYYKNFSRSHDERITKAGGMAVFVRERTTLAPLAGEAHTFEMKGPTHQRIHPTRLVAMPETSNHAAKLQHSRTFATSIGFACIVSYLTAEIYRR